MTESQVLDKVKKLLALAGNNPSQAEAEAAAAKAQTLLAQYNLTLTEGNDKEELMFTYYETGVDRAWKYNLASVVAQNFRCKCCWWGKSRVGFYGYKHDTEVAAEVFNFLFWTIRRNLRKVKKQIKEERGTAKGVIYSYSEGFIIGVKKVLDEQCTALMIVTPEEVTTGYKTWCTEHNVSAMSNTRRDAKDFNSETFRRGMEDGKSSMRSRQIEG